VIPFKIFLKSLQLGLVYLFEFLTVKYPRKCFALYAEACFANFGDRVKCWITINEPLQTAVNGYGIGVFAPGGCEGETSRCYLAAHHQILAHAAAVDVYRRKFKVFSWFLSELVAWFLLWVKILVLVNTLATILVAGFLLLFSACCSSFPLLVLLHSSKLSSPASVCHSYTLISLKIGN
jgi:hypothetical protein